MKKNLDPCAKAILKAWDREYSIFKKNGGWARIKNMPLAKRKRTT